MEYSKIKTIKAVNFRSLGNVELDMMGSPIVALTGTNESGKSSIIKAFGAAAGNLWRAKQNQNIREGTDGFAVLVELEDGTKVLRKKSPTINGYTLVTADGQRRDATKIDVEIPDYIEAVMGMYRDPETRESLQIRTCDDPLMFVNTTDGENYKAIHNAINNLDIREATNLAKADVSRLQAQANRKRDEAEIYKNQLAELPLLDTNYLKVILSALERGSKASKLFDKAKVDFEVLSELRGTEAIKELSKCDLVDTEPIRLFSDALRYLETLKESDAKNYDSVKQVDVTPLPLFDKAFRFIDDISSIQSSNIPDTVVQIGEGAIPLFERAFRYRDELATIQANNIPDTVLSVGEAVLPLFDKAFAYADTVSDAKASIEKLTVGIEKVSEILKNTGFHVVTCENCGHDMAVSSVV